MQPLSSSIHLHTDWIHTCNIIEEYLTSLTFEMVECRINARWIMSSLDPESDVRLLRSIDANGAPCHFSSTFSDCIIRILIRENNYMHISKSPRTSVTWTAKLWYFNWSVIKESRAIFASLATIIVEDIGSSLGLTSFGKNKKVRAPKNSKLYNIEALYTDTC